GQGLAFRAETRVERGDVLTLVGAQADVARAATVIGYAERNTITTDIVFVGLGIVLGGFVGLLTLTVAGVPLTLTASGGAPAIGVLFGCLLPCTRVFDTMGLTTFMAVVGISAGPGFVTGIKTTGISLVLVGLVVAILPHLVSILFGRYVLRMNPLILLGACSGAGTVTAALRAVE